MVQVYVFEDETCSTEQIGIEGLMTPSALWTEKLGSECTPPGNGECFAFSAACESVLATVCRRQPGAWTLADGKKPKALKVWYVDQGGKVDGFPVGAIIGIAAFLVVVVAAALWQVWLKKLKSKPKPASSADSASV